MLKDFIVLIFLLCSFLLDGQEDIATPVVNISFSTLQLEKAHGVYKTSSNTR